MNGMEFWVFVAATVVGLRLLWRARHPRPTVAEVHSGLEGRHYEVVLVLNGTDTMLRAEVRFEGTPDEATARATAREMILNLTRRVRFTPRTVYIPQGPLGLDRHPR